MLQRPPTERQLLASHETLRVLMSYRQQELELARLKAGASKADGNDKDDEPSEEANPKGKA